MESSNGETFILGQRPCPHFNHRLDLSISPSIAKNKKTPSALEGDEQVDGPPLKPIADRNGLLFSSFLFFFEIANAENCGSRENSDISEASNQPKRERERAISAAGSRMILIYRQTNHTVDARPQIATRFENFCNPRRVETRECTHSGD